ncbi:hypothetical protein FIU87_06375 [Bacillus sp. THAF10]|uniref:DUF1878 family protein n=1 Tax=Bacillus sp. THAF10 TaxID=2587848 RepID=UPI0012688C0F|nr:DUF1878 family protein [Bacillus sp. THAF10]QFT88261.1 hypothetical protein FIU87_06375 [Bacillus sp. THAF10]
MLEERLAALEFYMELVTKQLDQGKFPLDYLIIRRKLTREDVQFLFHTCEELSKEMEKQKAEGFVTFAPLLQKFQQDLHPNLDWMETIDALIKQDKYVPLMSAFLKLIKKK